VRVPDETKALLRGRQRGLRVGQIKYISPLRGPDGLGVDEKSVALVQHQGQRSQVMTLRVVELFRRPLGRPPRVGVEILQVLQTDRRRVVVAQKHRGDHRSERFAVAVDVREHGQAHGGRL